MTVGAWKTEQKNQESITLNQQIKKALKKKSIKHSLFITHGLARKGQDSQNLAKPKSQLLER